MFIKTLINKNLTVIPIWLVYLVGLLPAVILFYRAAFNRLGADPLKTLEHDLGEYALIFLIFLLLVNPIKRIFQINLMKFRRSIGLLSFWYVLLHFSTYLILDQQLMWELIIQDVLKRPYIIVGVLGFVVLIPLAVTSNRWSVRVLGSDSWRKLHRLVYLAAFLGVSHYLLLVKSWPIKPLLYFTLVMVLIAFRFGYSIKKYQKLSLSK